MKKILTILVAILITGTYTLLAQNSAGFNFEKTIHDFGRIKEEGGKVTYTFKFKNNGKKPIIIKNVQSTCGCTTPEWTKAPIVPGKEGFVSAEFDPHQRPGAFNKQIKVYNNLTTQPIVLEIKGDVIPKKKEIADIYRHKVGDIRLKSRHVAFARMYNTKAKTQSVEFINDSDKPVTVGVNEKYLKPHLKVSVSPKTVAPKQTGTITITFDASKKDNWGYHADRLPLMINGTPAPGYPLSVSATIVEDFSALSPQEIKDAPTMDFDEQEFNFGTIKQGDKVTHEFKFKNNGKRDLIIRDTQSSCGCTAVEAKKVIKPGETSSIKTTFNSAGKMGKQNKSITLTTNIPGKSKSGADKYRIILRVKGEVEKK
jgi:hypothetical protein